MKLPKIESIHIALLVTLIIITLSITWDMIPKEAQAAPIPVTPIRYISDWTEIPAHTSMIFEHKLKSLPVFMDVWVYFIGKDSDEIIARPYLEFGDQIHILKVSKIEIVVANTAPHPITVKVAASK